jgi:HlyD family secretion protein
MLQRVNIGRRNDSFAVVVDGLVPGDTVIMHPSDQLSDGTAVASTSEGEER